VIPSRTDMAPRMRRPGRPSADPSRQAKIHVILLSIAAGSFGIFTIVDSYVGGGSVSGEPDWVLPAARFLVQPLLVGAWLVLRRRARRPMMVLPDAPGVVAIGLALWFIVGAAVADDPVASLGRAVPFLFMIWGAFCVVGPSLATPGGTPALFRAAFVVSLLLASSAVAGAFLGHQPTWGVSGDRFYGPLSATTLGPICVTGLLGALVVWKVTAKRFARLVVVAASLWLLAVLVVARARGSYVFMLVSACVYFLLVSRRTMAIRVCAAAFVAALALVVAWNWWSLDLSQSSVAAYLRLDQRDMLAQRSEVWEANGSFWTQSPIFGIGLGNEATLSETAKRSHSAYLSTLNEGGVPALTLLLIAVAWIVARSLRTALRHPLAELRLLGVLAVTMVIGTAALGAVETTLINAASTSNTLVWITAGAAVAASRQVAHRAKSARRVPQRTFAGPARRMPSPAV